MKSCRNKDCAMAEPIKCGVDPFKMVDWKPLCILLFVRDLCEITKYIRINNINRVFVTRQINRCGRDLLIKLFIGNLLQHKLRLEEFQYGRLSLARTYYESKMLV